MDLGLNGKKALVLAASKGLGFAVAKALAAEGAHLAIVARDGVALEKAVKELAGAGTPVHAFVGDLAQAGEADRIVRAASERLGGIDILINNVGGPPPSAAATTDLTAWQKGFEQLFLSVVAATRAVLPRMTARGFGRIITITSTSVVEPIDHLVVSTAMRSAVTGFSRTLASEVAKHNITVNTVMPGVIHTGRIEALRTAKAARDGTTLGEEIAKTAAAIPMGRLGRPEELGDFVAFLASERASYMTGLNIAIDGGLRKGF